MNQRTSQLFQHLFQKAARQPPQPPNVEAREVVRLAGPSPSVPAKLARGGQACHGKLSVHSKNRKTHIAFNSKNLRKKSRSATGGCILSRTLYHTAYISKKVRVQVARSPAPQKKHHQKCNLTIL